jgi:hypothetical protein
MYVCIRHKSNEFGCTSVCIFELTKIYVYVCVHVHVHVFVYVYEQNICRVMCMCIRMYIYIDECVHTTC